MSTLSVDADSLHKRVKQMAEGKGFQMNQFITLAVRRRCRR